VQITTVKRVGFIAVCMLACSTIHAGWADIQTEPAVRILSLNDCIEAALENSADLKNLLDRLPASQERFREAKRKQWPSLSLAVTDNTGLGDSGAFSQYDPSTGQRFVPGEGFQTSADLSWSLYDSGNRRSVIRAEQQSLSLLNLSIIQARRDIVHQVIALYLAVLERQSEVDVRTEQLAQALESLNVATARLQTGSGIAYEVLLEEAYLAQARADLQSTEFALNNAERTLLLAMRQNISARVVLEPVDPGDPVDVPETGLVDLAAANRLEFDTYLAEIESFRQQLKTLKAARLPSLDFVASYSQQGQDFESYKNGDISWSAGLSLRFSPFSDASVYGSTARNWINSSEFMQRSSLGLLLNDGSATKSRETEIMAELRRLQMELAYLRDIIGAEALDAYESYRESHSILDARRKNLAAMEENERIQQKRYELGLNQYKDVVDARTELIAARIALNRAIYSMEYYRMNLEYILGLLDYQESSL
jgi:outer membrane protein TolC